MEEKNIRRIVVTGVHKADIIMYCAYVLQKLEYRVLVCDMTRNHELEYCIRKPDKPMELVRYKNMDFAFSELVSLEEGYDYIFFVQDFDDLPPRHADKRIFICDGDRAAMEALIRDMSRIAWNEKCCAEACMILYRDLYVSYGMEYVKTRMRSKLEGMCIHSIHHDCMDEACYERMQFRPFSHMAEVSADMELAVRRVLEFCTGIDAKSVKRGVKMSKRGRAY